MTPNLVARRTSAGPLAEPEPIQKIIQAIASALFCALLIVPGLDHRFQWSRVWFPLVLAGNVLIAISSRDRFCSVQEKQLCLRRGTSRKRAAGNIYRSLCVRTPSHVCGCAGLLLIATPLALGSWWGIPVGLMLCAVIVVRLSDEERRLAADLSGYEEYRRKVPYRIVPKVW
jgi:protein-S-isoprenylcysteine O-methyltransferase Ste14